MKKDWLQKLSPKTRKAMQKLEESLKQMPQIAAAYSGGMDSTLLAILVRFFKPEFSEVLLVKSEFMSKAELDIARSSSKACGLRHRELSIKLLESSLIKENPKDRCYHCKHKIFTCLINTVKEQAILCDGSVIDDQDDYRPGKRALKELSVRSPLAENGFDKKMIAETLNAMGYTFVVRPGQSCLATRIHTGITINEQDLEKIEKGEKLLAEMGFINPRLRLHSDLVRIELPFHQLHRGIDILQQLTRSLKKLGFRYICLDINGYQRGSMNL